MYSDYFERNVELDTGDIETLLDIYETVMDELGEGADYDDRELVDFEEDTALLDTVLYHVHTFGRNHEAYGDIAHVFQMTFDEFLNAPKALAMSITVEEYKSIKPLLQEVYSEKDIERIDDYCRFKPGHERFLLCNLEEKSAIGTPMMYFNAVTFIDRVPFKDVAFPEGAKGVEIKVSGIAFDNYYEYWTGTVSVNGNRFPFDYNPKTEAIDVHCYSEPGWITGASYEKPMPDIVTENMEEVLETIADAVEIYLDNMKKTPLDDVIDNARRIRDSQKTGTDNTDGDGQRDRVICRPLEREV